MDSTTFKGRVIRVATSTNDAAKRQATTIINPRLSRSSYSPTPDANNTNPDHGTAAGLSPASQSSATQTNPAASSDRNARTIALMKLPDTGTYFRSSSSLFKVFFESDGTCLGAVCETHLCSPRLPDNGNADRDYQQLHLIASVCLEKLTVPW